MATAEATFDDPWDDTAVNERRKPNRSLIVQRGDIVSLDLGKSFNGVLKLDRTLDSTKCVIKLPSLLKSALAAVISSRMYKDCLYPISKRLLLTVQSA